MQKINVEIKRLDHAKDLPLPSYGTEESAGVDLCAAIEETEVLGPGQRKLIPTGLCIALPKGYEAQMRPRSGLAVKHGITVLNTPGTVDSDYRGELFACLINHGQDPFEVERGMRIAQLVIAPVNQVTWVSVDTLDETQRGEGGFGSTGMYAKSA